MKTILEAKGICKTFRRGIIVKSGSAVLHNVDLTLDKGKTLALIGQSGSGKTTLARVLSRLIEPSAGRIVFRGEDITDIKGEELRRLRKGLQIVFQDPYASLDRSKNINKMFNEVLDAHFRLSDEERAELVQAVLAECTLPRSVLGLKPAQLSGGQRQRTALARSLVLSPDVLIADEITSALDVETQAAIVDTLLSRQEKDGLAMLFISHDLDLARSVADEIAVIYRGYIVERGKTEEVVTSPAHPYTERLVAAAKWMTLEKAEERTVPQSACPYAALCPRCRSCCLEAKPEAIEVGNGHWVSCLFA